MTGKASLTTTSSEREETEIRTERSLGSRKQNARSAIDSYVTRERMHRFKQSSKRNINSWIETG